MDHAMRRVSWNLANCHATVQKLLVRQVQNKSKLWSWRVTVRQCVINIVYVHSTVTRSRRFHCPIGVINKPNTGELWISPVYDTIRDAILTGARKPTWVSLIYRTETTTNKKLSYRWGTARCVVSVEILSIATQQYFPLRTTSLAAALSIVQKLLVRQILNQVSAVANWPVRENRAVDSAWRSVR